MSNFAPPLEQNLSIPEALARANAHWNAGQADQAEMLCQRILAVWPGHSDASHLLGLMAHAYGNLDLAITHLRQACQSPRAPALYASNLAEMCRQNGLLAEGEAAGRRAVAQDPSLPGAWNNLGIILQESGKYEESRRCLERVLALQPDNAEAYNNFGNTAKRLGRIAEAERAWARALELKPNYAEPHSNLANLLSEQAEYVKAAQHAHRAIELNPRLADAYINLSGIESTRGNEAEALHWLNALLAFAPTHATALASRALALKKLDRLEEALDSANSALAAAPENAEAHNAQGQVLQALGRFDAALAAYDRAAELPGTAAEQALVNRAVQFMEHGRQAEAEAAFALAAIAFPRSASARFNHADLKKFASGDPEVASMEAMLGAEPSHADQILLHFALGKAYLDIGDSARAFQHLNQGNAMKRSIIEYDPDASTRWIQQITEIYTPELLEKLGNQGARSPSPIFVVGMPRSGTTLLEQILGSHPAIHSAGELPDIQNIAAEYGAFSESMVDSTPERLREAGQKYLHKITPLAAGRPHIVDKMPLNFALAGFIRLILPAARIIHSRRDAADTCLSCYSKLFASGQAFTYNQAELARFHRGYQNLMSHWREILPPSHFLEVGYESVTENPEAEARRILAFLELEWDASCLDFHKAGRAVKTASVNQIRQPVYKTSAGRWKKHEQHLGPLLEALNAP